MIGKFFSLFKSADTAEHVDSPEGGIERARALHFQGQLDAALALCEQVIAAFPGSAEAHYRRANVLKDQGALEAAAAAYDQAIALRFDDTRALCNRAVVLGQLHKLPEALASYDRAIALDPNDALIHCNRGMLLNAIGQKDAALAAFDTAIACDPALREAHFGRGALLQERQQWLDSLTSYERAIALDSADIAAQFNRATVLRQLERWTDALAGYDGVVALNGALAPAHAGRADSLQQLMRLEEALESYGQAIALSPKDATMHNSRGILLQKMGRFDAALASYNEAVAEEPTSAQVHFNRGTLRAELQDLEGALADYRKAIAIDPKFAEAHLNLALTLLKKGDYPSGWAHYEWRWRTTRGPILIDERTFGQPLWLGKEDIAGRTILLYGEQGLGDSLQFCRFCEIVAEKGAQVILEVPERLASVCATLRGVTKVVSRGEELPEFDFRCPLMSLPLALKTTLETVPADVPYLKSERHRVTAWQERLGEKAKPWIGLTWSGSIGSRTFGARSYSLAQLIPHLPPEFDYFCLQIEVTEADQQTLFEYPVIRQFDAELLDFSGTAALFECLDVVVTADTSIAHLSGAMGKPTWVLIPYNGDWRWLSEREDTPWYPSVRLFRQKSRGDWDTVFQRLNEHLRMEFSAPILPKAPI